MQDAMVKIIRSNRRRKTIQAKMVNGEFWVYLPAGLSVKEEEKWVVKMQQRFEKQKRHRLLNSDGALQQRAQELNKKFFGGRLEFEIQYVTNQTSKFGCCDTRKKQIRISDRVVKTPYWVQDYVLIHELAHLMYPNHGNQFWTKVNEYRFVERAKGYLIAVGMMKEEKI
jgi:predicted metal-dependent hydrolase